MYLLYKGKSFLKKILGGDSFQCGFINKFHAVSFSISTVYILHSKKNGRKQ